jgi:hypothetical protein
MIAIVLPLLLAFVRPTTETLLTSFAIAPLRLGDIVLVGVIVVIVLFIV